MNPVVTEVQDFTAISAANATNLAKELICGRAKSIRLDRRDGTSSISTFYSLEYRRQIPYNGDTMPGFNIFFFINNWLGFMKYRYQGLKGMPSNIFNEVSFISLTCCYVFRRA